MLSELKVGDPVVRLLTDEEQRLTDFVVLAITEDRLYVGVSDGPYGPVMKLDDCWIFDKATGVEIDADLGWGPEGVSGSVLDVGQIPKVPDGCRLLTRNEMIVAKLSRVT